MAHASVVETAARKFYAAYRRGGEPEWGELDVQVQARWFSVAQKACDLADRGAI